MEQQLLQPQKDSPTGKPLNAKTMPENNFAMNPAEFSFE
jgi:hypothetical protein